MNLPKLLLFDTGCIFEVVKLGLWEQLCKRFRVVVPSTVVRDEALFVNLRPGNITPIDLSHDVATGLIEEYAASASELKQVLELWPKAILDRADAGEVEAVAYLRARGTDDTAFLTADGPAIQAAVSIECEGEPMSLEELLQLAGCPRSNLDWQYTKEFVAIHRQKAVDHLLSQLAPPPARGRRRK